MNLRPLEPHSSALPGCATPRRFARTVWGTVQAYYGILKPSRQPFCDKVTCSLIGNIDAKPRRFLSRVGLLAIDSRNRLSRSIKGRTGPGSGRQKEQCKSRHVTKETQKGHPRIQMPCPIAHSPAPVRHDRRETHGACPCLGLPKFAFFSAHILRFNPIPRRTMTITVRGLLPGFLVNDRTHLLHRTNQLVVGALD